MSAQPPLADAYETTGNPLFPVLRALGWGDLVNLGYYTPLTWPRLLTGLAPFQRALAERSIGLLNLADGDRVLDVACGTGYTTRCIRDRGATVTGVDLYPPHIATAVQRHGHRPGVCFLTADATDLGPAVTSRPSTRPSFGDATYNKIHCLEAAFHFGPQGRRSFLEQAYRILAPGGRLVLVDFAWSTNQPGDIAAADPGRLVRTAWAFEEFEPVGRYIRHAIDIGFAPCRVHDWTHAVTRPFMALGTLIARLALSATGRRLLCSRWPGLQDLTSAQWLTFAATAVAHRPVQRASRYIALTLDKSPSATTGRNAEI
ncbi:SAM-dependent methyltransferase [Streptomyces monomycini]|uniref:SAM-dependent methyltransferase n=1 Tax=Streptomyces monomycini TaxID=371720 RepID=UPI0007C473B4|nr:class I SAM-dependent methyltransferase [Streptomyces monomycini]